MSKEHEHEQEKKGYDAKKEAAMNSEYEKTQLAAESVNAIEGIMGAFPGYRRAHAKGVSYKAVFTPNGQASSLTTAPHLQTAQIPAIVRFSNVAPDPTLSDALSPAKGLAVQFQLPNGEITNIVATTVPFFISKTPKSFVSFLKALRSGKNGRPNLRALVKWLTKYPESRSVFRIWKELKPPLSFAQGRYHSIHAFYFVNQEGHRQAVKYILEPEAGEAAMSNLEAAGKPEDYFEQELENRLASDMVHFRLKVQLGKETDPTDDPTKEWPKERRVLMIGRLSIQKERAAGEELLFDPTVLPEGIKCSEDQILQFRRFAYEESYRRRSRNS